MRIKMISVNAVKALKKNPRHLEVEVRVKGLKRLRLRIWCATRLIILAGRFIGAKTTISMKEE